MLAQLQEKLKTAVNFPSPPAVAQQIIALASDPDVDIVKLTATISKDPGLAAKILRVANSPIYSKRRKSDNLRQALVVLGLNAATTLALSFSLVGTYKKIKSVGIDYTSYWHRAILGASAARAFATAQRVNNLEDIFLAALLQDIAVLAIDRVQSDFYGTLPEDASHHDLATYEASQAWHRSRRTGCMAVGSLEIAGSAVPHGSTQPRAGTYIRSNAGRCRGPLRCPRR